LFLTAWRRIGTSFRTRAVGPIGTSSELRIEALGRTDKHIADTHNVTKTKVVQLENGTYGVEFEFDDGNTDFAEVGSKETAEFYATVQMGEAIVMGVNPLLLNAEKAGTLRRRQE
jgi:hypothetical protein